MSEHQHPAFPVAEDHKVAADLPWTCGLTKREWFAGQALVGCFNFWAQVHGMGATIGDPDKGGITRLSYEYADAMLEAGAEPQPVQYRELYPSEQEKIAAAELLAKIVEDLQKAQGWADLPQELRIAARNAAIDVLEPPLPF